eukprot:UN15004
MDKLFNLVTHVHVLFMQVLGVNREAFDKFIHHQCPHPGQIK